MALFLLEIGTEELPADFARLALPQLADRVRSDLKASRLGFGSIQVTSTPRRLAVLVDGLSASQEDGQVEHKGPPAQLAFQDGLPTPAAIGFAKRCGLAVDQLELRDTPKGPVVFATTRLPGRPTAMVLAESIPGWIWGLQGRRFMRWGQGESRFSRPVRWLVALLDGEVIPVELPDCDPPVRSGRLSRGHRLMAPSLSIDCAANYSSLLAAAHVLVEREARAASIQTQLDVQAELHGAQLDLPASLFEELVDLVEDPRVIVGEIEPVFLSLPPEVLSTVMRAHQRYVPMLRPDRVCDPLALGAEQVLWPHFLCVCNGMESADATVKRGNERVLRARLADAAFFLQADHAVASIDRREALERVTFAEGLGSLRDRTERLEWCTDVLLDTLGLPEDLAHVARRATHLCKHDLVSQMVGEFPELQGIMGAKYLLAEGESREVALAVLEHYRPRGTGDDLPQSLAGAVLALAERFELLLSIFSRGDRPTGSSDPYALRRAGNGILQIVWNQNWPLDMASFLDRAVDQWHGQLSIGVGVDAGVLRKDLSEFLRQRFLSLLEDEGLNLDLVRSVAQVGTEQEDRLLRNVCDAKSRVLLLQNLRDQGRLAAIQSVVQRASRLADKAEMPRHMMRADQCVDPGLFERHSEEAFCCVLNKLAPIAESGQDYGALIEGLEESGEVISAFFDGEDSVLVMSEDRSIRQNRLAMLTVFRNQASVIANFSELEGAS